MIKNKRIVIFGGAGSIGSEIVRQLSLKNKIYVVDNNESGLFDLTESLKEHWVKGRVGDIRDYKMVSDVFQDFKPQIVINAAAYKHVGLMEYTPLEAIQTNVLGHYNIVHLAKTWECVEKLIFISTDKAVSSNSIMGATKRLSEIITKNMGYTIVRFGNVMGSRGSLTTIWQRQHDEGKPLTVTDERMTRYMMTIPQAMELVIKAIEETKGGEIFILKMGQKWNILNLATLITAQTKQGIEMIGSKYGETLTEDLLFEEEKKRAVETENYYVVT